jgi:serine/threonine-protein kinase
VSDSWIGKIVGNCRIEEKIGEGGCGEVYRGVDQMLDRPVAIKVLHPGLATRRDLAERFRSEALMLARLSHPNVALLYSFHQEGDAYLMVMEYVPGKTFDVLLREQGRMPPEQAVPLVLQALDGIQHAHELGIIHRDLKGSNVMQSRSGVVKVMDFGIARALGTPGLTQVDHPVGTPEYMSPEQVQSHELDPRADVYSMGVLLFKMLAGRLPFTGKSHYDLMRAQVEQQPPSLRDFVPSLPAALEEVVLQALSKSREQRFSSAAELRGALEAAWEKSPETAPAVTPNPGAYEAVGLDAKTTPLPLDGSDVTGHEAPTRILSEAGSKGRVSPETTVPIPGAYFPGARVRERMVTLLSSWRTTGTLTLAAVAVLLLWLGRPGEAPLALEAGARAELPEVGSGVLRLPELEAPWLAEGLFEPFPEQLGPVLPNGLGSGAVVGVASEPEPEKPAAKRAASISKKRAARRSPRRAPAANPKEGEGQWVIRRD